jgi:flagellar protein FlbD
LNQVPLVVNSDLIEHIEVTPDTVISLTTGQKFMVRETSDQIIERIVEFRRAVLTGMPGSGWPAPQSDAAFAVETSSRLANHEK